MSQAGHQHRCNCHGCQTGNYLGRYVEIAGGFALIVIGSSIVCQHLNA